MKEQQRLDKVLAHIGIGSRKQIRHLAKKGEIAVNGQIVKDSGYKLNPVHDEITVSGRLVQYQKFVYVMLNKPKGVLTATEDRAQRTVIDLLDDGVRHFRPFPVGRLDKDTTGLLLLTNDGALAHRLLSPKHRVPKVYEAVVLGKITPKEQDRFRNGIMLNDGYKTMPAQLDILSYEERTHRSVTRVTLSEGKYHQVKRMFAAVGSNVQELKRLSMGPLVLDPDLHPGDYRELTENETQALQKLQQT